MSLIPSSFVDGVLTLSDDGAHSEVLELAMGDMKLSGVTPDGRNIEISESRGAVVGLRKTTRAKPMLSMSAMLASPSAAFHRLALGKTSGFVSTSADIGDGLTNDLSFTFNYGAETRNITADDLLLRSWDVSEGPTSTISLNFEVIGPLELDGVSIIPSR